jgi:hypothetical protein
MFYNIDLRTGFMENHRWKWSGRPGGWSGSGGSSKGSRLVKDNNNNNNINNSNNFNVMEQHTIKSVNNCWNTNFPFT